MHEALMAGGSGTQREASAMLLSAVMMLDWLSDKHADSALADGARAIEIAMQRSFADGQVRSREFGGTSAQPTSFAPSWRSCDMSPQSHTTAKVQGADGGDRVAMIGAGYWAQFQVEGWRDAGAPLVAISNRHLANAEALAQRYGVPKCYADVATMLDAERPTLVDVVLPPVAQESAVRAAIERGIPTICQKPFGTDLKQAQAMTEMAEAAGVPLVIHENFRFAPWFCELGRLIDDGFFGRVHRISFRLRPGDGQGPQAYLDRQPYFQTMPEFLVRETAVHFIDTFRFLMGEVVAVTARLRRLNPVILGEDAGIFIFEFGDERTGLFDGNRLNEHPAKNMRRTMGEMWLEGERGVMRLDGNARLWWMSHQGVEAEHVYDDGAGRGAFGGASTALQAHVLSHLHQGTPLQNSARDYLSNLYVQAAVYHSHTSGRRVMMASFDPHQPT